MSSLLSWFFFQISGTFPTCLGCFLPTKTTNKNCWIIEIFLFHFFAIFKVLRPRLTKMGLETRLVTETKSRDSITDDYSIYAVWFYNNHTLYSTTLRWKTRTKFAVIKLKVELNRYLKLFYCMCISMYFDCTFVSF